jgi:hypothetical protein
MPWTSRTIIEAGREFVVLAQSPDANKHDNDAIRNAVLRHYISSPASNLRQLSAQNSRRPDKDGYCLPGDRAITQSKSLSGFIPAGSYRPATSPGYSSIQLLFVSCLTAASSGPDDHDLFGFLTTEPNDVVGPVHPKAMPVILTTPEEIETWMTAPAEEALKLQRPLPDGALRIVATGVKEDGEAA